MKQFVKDWGWLITAALIPIAVLAAERKFATRGEFEAVSKKLDEAVNDLEHHESMEEVHMSYMEEAVHFVPRQELAPILERIEQEQKETSQKLDRVLLELRKR